MCKEDNYFQVRLCKGKIHTCTAARGGVDTIYTTLCGRRYSLNHDEVGFPEEDATCKKCLKILNKGKEGEVIIVFNHTVYPADHLVVPNMEDVLTGLSKEFDYDEEDITEDIKNGDIELFRATRVMVEPVMEITSKVVGLKEVKRS